MVWFFCDKIGFGSPFLDASKRQVLIKISFHLYASPHFPSISGTIRLLLWPRQVSCGAAHCCAIFLCCIDLAEQLYTCCLSKSTQNPDHHLSVIGTNARCSFTPLGEIFNAVWVLYALFDFHISDAHIWKFFLIWSIYDRPLNGLLGGQTAVKSSLTETCWSQRCLKGPKGGVKGA